MSLILRKISRSQLKAWAIGHLKTQQGGKCAICGRPINLSVGGHKSDMIVDHDHSTGRIRGVLCRGCNGAEGRIANAAGRWAALGMDYSKIIPWLESLVLYLKQEPTQIIYPDHKTDEQKAEAAKQKAKVAAARRRAVAKMKEQGNGN